jgi:hydrogenase maturation protease
MSQAPERPTRQILVAGIGNTWMKDDGFGSEVVKVLAERPQPPGVSVVDFGTSGLDLAYEVMRGYDGLILVDISRQGEPAGTLYVMEADPDGRDARRRRRHGDGRGAAVRRADAACMSCRLRPRCSTPRSSTPTGGG